VELERVVADGEVAVEAGARRGAVDSGEFAAVAGVRLPDLGKTIDAHAFAPD
jgi:hypothetical protein